jgi:hypothetical protein
MDVELSKWVDEAANIGASGRWAAVNEKIKQLCANPVAGNAWWVEVFSSLCASVFSEYLSLKHAYEDPHSESALIAWRARSLLELSVWSIYCSRDTENARRLYADGGRDVLGLFSAFVKWSAATGQESTDAGAADQAKSELRRKAAVQGVESLEGKYKEVSEAAKEVGMGDHFALSNRLLSKFAHPTAMQVLAPKTAMQKAVFFSQGCLFFVGAFNELEKQLNPAKRAHC